MADDIDIVEHDLLNNPLVQKIFPDLAVLKKETTDLDNEVPMENTPKRYDINEQQKNDQQVMNAEINAYTLSLPRNSTDKAYSRICVGNTTQQQDLHEDHEGNKYTSCCEVIIKSHYMEEETTEDQQATLKIGKLSSLVIEKLLVTTNFFEQKVNDNDLKLHSPRLFESTFMNHHQLEERKKSEKTNVTLTNSFSPLKCRKMKIGPKSSLKHAKEKMSRKQNKLKNIIVVLENINTFLSKSSRYCKICCRLFPSNKTLGDHQNLIHAQLGHSEPRELAKQLAKDMPLKRKNRYECNICGAMSLTLSGLFRHKKTIHLVNKVNVGENAGNLEHNFKSHSRDKSKSNSIPNSEFASQQLLIDHMSDVTQSKNEVIPKSLEIQEGEIVATEKGTSTKMFYRCSYCYYYIKRHKVYITHMKNKHNHHNKFELEKVPFDPMCKYCSNIYCSVSSFNAHIRKHHLPQNEVGENETYNISIKEAGNISKRLKLKEQMINLKENRIQSKLNMDEKDIKKNERISTVIDSQRNPRNQYLLQSALFKCLKCDICFLSATKAADHVDHMDMLINWKCLKCFKIFKKEDESLHMHQHLFTDTFDVYEIRDITHLAVLYKCPNCITYFQEKDFFNHYSVCEMQSPVSAYCKICHNLIDDKIKGLHDMHHKQLLENTQLRISFVESDVIIYNQENYIIDIDITKQELINNKLFEPRDLPKLKKISKVPAVLSFTYCAKCECFVRRSPNLSCHTTGRCFVGVKYVCRFCGLILSNRSINFHRKMHKHIPGLTLQDFKFYDLNSGKVICPPVPKYPNCYKCGKHFITKTAITSHQCNEDYLTCSVCNIKLCKMAFPLHKSFHNYLLEMAVSGISNNPKVSSSEVASSSMCLVDSNENEKDDQLLVYLCKSCKIAFDVYDRVIEHCQDHISGQETEIKTKPCDTCHIIFEMTCIDHIIFHKCNRDKEFVVLSFDVFYVTAELDIWLNHLFGSLPKELIDKILKNSIYKYERTIKMKIVQKGLKCLTLYKCGKCEKYIDSTSLYKHCQTDILCFNSKTLECSYCGIQVVSEEYLHEHKKIHEKQHVTLTSYRIVIFNCDEDKSINHVLSLPNQYVLYECRNCNGIVDKMDFNNHKCDHDDLMKCSHCGLLIRKNEYVLHALKHKEFCSFNESNMKIISIGQVKNGSKLKHNLVPSFRGIRSDYLMYQCNKCQICVKDKKSISIHDCLLETVIRKCVKCELYIDDSQFQNHRMIHASDRYFLKENITVVKFGPINSTPSDEDVIVIEDEDGLGSRSNNILDCNKLNKLYKSQSDTVTEKYDEIYKCTCGLHFLIKEVALLHCKTCTNFSSTKQTCSKCGLDFLPSDLYNHLLLHHGSKNVSYKLNIIEISYSPRVNAIQTYVIL